MFKMVVLSDEGSNFLRRESSLKWVSPPLSPPRGYPPSDECPWFTDVLSWFACSAAPPTSVGFMARATVLVGRPPATKPPHRPPHNDITHARVRKVSAL